jgi:hypothetical protein
VNDDSRAVIARTLINDGERRGKKGEYMYGADGTLIREEERG